jgi:hypothetical protein
MSVSMRPVLMAALRDRWALPLVPLAITLVMRIAGESDNGWIGSELQIVVALVVFLALIPMLAIAMATGWLRGDAVPWSWAWARPISRARWLLGTLMVDLVVLLACVMLSSLVLGTLPLRGLGPWPGGGPREIGYAAVLAMTYGAAAFAGARGATAIGGALHVAVLATLGSATTVLATLTEDLLEHRYLGHSFHWYLALRGVPFHDSGRIDDEAQSFAIAIVMLAFVTIIVLRAAARSPAPPRLRAVIAPLALAALFGGVLAPWTIFAVTTWIVR